MTQPPTPPKLLFSALQLTDPEMREDGLKNYIASRNMSITPSEVITIMKDACEIGQPIVDTVCPIIEVIPT
jgi:hypothetical protein